MPIKKRGLTLIELVMTIVLVGILAGMLTFSVREVVDLWSFWSFRTEIVAQGRLSLARMTRELRQIANNSSVSVADVSRVQFRDIGGNSIEYRVSGSDLTRNTNVLARGVKSLAFDYYDSANTRFTALPLDATNRTRIAIIGVALTLSAAEQERTLKAKVCPRNRER